MQIGILITAMLLGLLVFFGLALPAIGKARNGHERDRRTGFGASNPFHAVSIQPTQEGCSAADAIKIQRFLSEDAPGLPLPDCSSPECRCKYVHYADRRDGARDRRLAQDEASEESEFWSLRERRLAGGRRQEDMAAA